MSDLSDDIRSAFEGTKYTVADVTENRGQVRIELLDPDAEADALREVLDVVVDLDDVFGPNVTTESADGQGVRTVITFRQR
jgi:lipoate synthase